jgi:hypothetical protein
MFALSPVPASMFVIHAAEVQDILQVIAYSPVMVRRKHYCTSVQMMLLSQVTRESRTHAIGYEYLVMEGWRRQY